MILLDTNIISELMKETPHSSVTAWLREQEPSNLFISTITIAEISYGLQLTPEGARRRTLENAFKKSIDLLFSQKILTFDQTAAEIYGHLMAHRKEIGKPMTMCNGQIAATALAHQADLATRNTEDFLECHLELINPFNS